MLKKSVENEALEDKLGRKYFCSIELMDEKSSNRQTICSGCGTIIKSNKNSNYCSECEEIFYDEP